MKAIHGELDAPCEPAYHTEIDQNGDLVVHLDREEFSAVPPLWYVINENPNGTPPNIALLAFATQEKPAGTIITPQQAQQLDINPQKQIAAIQWGYKDPRIHQIAVHPDWRRKRIALALIATADTVNMAGNYSGDTMLYGGDVTTQGGEKLRDAWKNSPRVTPRQGEIKKDHNAEK